jgi:hypothetical protein
MFGEMNVVPVMDHRKYPEIVTESVDEAISRLLVVTEYPAIAKWLQLPKALLVFLVVPGDPESGAIYVYNRSACTWFWVDFDDEKFGGYSLGDFEKLVKECRFLDIIAHPNLLSGTNRWFIQPGIAPRRAIIDLEMKKTPHWTTA